jgi:glutathione S-transferase
MLKLYGVARSRATIVRWYLEELGVPYDFVLLDMGNGEHLKEPFTQINPFGKVPAIVDRGWSLYESGAILLYLYQTYDPLGKAATVAEIATINQWILFANSTLAQGVFIEANREKEMPRLLGSLNKIFAEGSFVIGNKFSVADVAVGSMLAYIPLLLKLDLSDYPAVGEYLEKVTNRPAYQKAMSGR